MLRIALKGILGRKARLVLTSLAVILGTAFLSGTAVFSATLNRTFDNLFSDVFRNVDSYVRSTQVIEADFGAEERQRIPAELIATIEAVPGVGDVQGDIQAFARIIGKDGQPLGSDGAGPPTFGSVGEEFKGALWTISEGKFPSNSTEVALDEASAKAGNYVVGDTVKVVAQAGSREFTLVGIAGYGDVRSPGGATFALFDLATAQEFLAKPGFVDAILISGDGSASDEELAKAINAVIPSSYKTETLTGAEITKETQDQIGSALSFFSILLSTFSYIALGVGSFVIYNVFSISAAQRQRENALLRAIGASKKQVTRALMIESVVVGLFGSTIGLFAGIGLSKALSALLKAASIDLPSGDLVVPSSAIINTIVVGLIVTVASAWLPARRAGRVPPLAAMRETAIEVVALTRRRTIFGLALIALGAASIIAVTNGASNTWLGLGILFVFSGTITLGPVIARPVALLLGKPAEKFRGVTGTMARQNSARNPKRTSRTASPVLIGVALVTAVAALAASISSQIDGVFTQQFKGDYAINTNARGFGGLSPSLADDINTLPEVERATGIGLLTVKIDGKGQYLTTINPATVEGVFDIGLTSGTYADLTPETIFVSQQYAENNDAKLGDTIAVTLADAQVKSLSIAGIYEFDELAGKYTVSRDLTKDTTVITFDLGVYIKIKDGVSQESARTALQAAVDKYGQGTLLSKREYIDSQSGQINQLLGLIYGLLFLSVIIAVVGIIITLLLSVFERQREIGLLRAVGMTKSQVRTTVRWESVITSLLGAVVGIVLGVGLGWVIVYALRDQGLSSFSVPVGTTVSILIMAFVIGVLAAVYPAWRATRVNLLSAITTA
jgi:putative ABC transport system permease protein